MTKLLTKIFVKNSENTDDPHVRRSYGTFSSIVGICTNFILAIIKFIAGLISGSVAITADAFNNMTDAGSSVITLFSFKISAKPADRNHPFGHARIEYIASMIVSFIILLVGFELFFGSFESLFNNEEIRTVIDTVTFVILGVSILLKLWLGIFYITISKKIESDVLRATATDCFSDTVSTVAVLISSIVIGITGWNVIDAIVGIAVSALIIVAGAKILNETKNALLGEAPIDDVVKGVERIVAEYPDIIGMHDLMIHNYGPRNFIASFHAEVDGQVDIYYLHDMIDNAERHIKNELGIACTIHMDPIVTDDEEINKLKAFLTEIVNKLDLGLSIHDFRTVVGNTHTNLIFDVVVPFECKIPEEEIKLMVSNAVAEARENCFCVITVDRG